MTRKITKAALAVGLLAVTARSLAAEQALPMPPKSAYVDTESSTTVQIPTDQGPRIRLTLAFEPTLSNAVQVAFGRDLDADGDLAPEETDLVTGCDCGEWFFRDERVSLVRQDAGGAVPNQQTDQPSDRQTRVFTLKQPLAQSNRWDLAKVTTHNLVDTNLTVVAEFYSAGTAIILR